MAWARTSFRSTPEATDSERAASLRMVRLGRQCYAVDISRAATALAAEIDPVAERQPRIQQVKTKFLRLRLPAMVGHRIGGWRVCLVEA